MHVTWIAYKWAATWNPGKMSPNSALGTGFHFCTLVGVCRTWVCCPEPVRNVTEDFFFYLNHFRWYSFYTLPFLLFFVRVRSYLIKVNLLKWLQSVIPVMSLSGPVNTCGAICAQPDGRCALRSSCPCVSFLCCVGLPASFSVYLTLGHAPETLPSPDSLQFLIKGHDYICTRILTFIWLPRDSTR